MRAKIKIAVQADRPGATRGRDNTRTASTRGLEGFRTAATARNRCDIRPPAAMINLSSRGVPIVHL
jgi:hypothetical protein